MSTKVHKQGAEWCWNCTSKSCKGCMFVKQETKEEKREEK